MSSNRSSGGKDIKTSPNSVQTFKGRIIKGNVDAFHREWNKVHRENCQILYSGQKAKFWKEPKEFLNAGYTIDGTSDPSQYSQITKDFLAGSGRASAFIEKMTSGHKQKTNKEPKMHACRAVLDTVNSGASKDEIIEKIQIFKETPPLNGIKSLNSLTKRIENIFSKYEGLKSINLQKAETVFSKDMKAVSKKLSKALSSLEYFVGSNKVDKPFSKCKDFQYSSKFRRETQNVAGSRIRSIFESRQSHREELRVYVKNLHEILDSEKYIAIKEECDLTTKFFSERVNKTANSKRKRWVEYRDFIINVIVPSLISKGIIPKEDVTDELIQDIIKKSDKAKKTSKSGMVDSLFKRFPVLREVDQTSNDVRLLKIKTIKKPYYYREVHAEKSPGFAAWTGADNGMESVVLRSKGNHYFLDLVLSTERTNSLCITVSIDARMAKSLEFRHWLESWYYPDGKRKKNRDAMALGITVSCSLSFRKKNRKKIDLKKCYVSFVLTRPSKARIVELKGVESKVSIHQLNIIGHRSKDTEGLIVDQVFSDNGIKVGDVISLITKNNEEDGKEENCSIVESKGKSSASKLANTLFYKHPGSQIKILVIRNGEHMTLDVSTRNAPLVACDMSQGDIYAAILFPDGKKIIEKIEMDPKDISKSRIGKEIKNTQFKRDLGISLKNRVQFDYKISEAKSLHGNISYKAQLALLNARDTAAKTAASRIVEVAERYSGFLVIEDLSTKMSGDNFRGQNRYAANWNRSDIEKYIRQIASVKGVSMKAVNPSLTSMLCSVCLEHGKINFVWRYRIKGGVPEACKTGKSCICPSCGSEMHPDINASINIANAFKGKISKAKDAYFKMSAKERSDFLEELELKAKDILRKKHIKQLDDFEVSSDHEEHIQI